MSHENINRIIMTCNIAKDAEHRSFPSGAQLATFRVASNRRNGKASFFSVELWGERAKKLAEHLTKGKAIAIDGHLESKEWEAGDKSKRYDTVVVVDQLEFLDARGERTSEKPAPRRRPSASRTAKGAAAKGTGTKGRAKGATRGRARSKS